MADRVSLAADELYRSAPQDFVSRRAALVAAARRDGDRDAASAIAALRKPTAAAAAVNRLALEDPTVGERLDDLGTRMRRAQDALEPAALRDLGTERRELVADLSRAAAATTGQDQPTPALLGEITATFDAAVADPDVAGRLGRLTRAEHWSGFGFAPTGSAELTLVRGGRDGNAPRRSTPAVEPPSTEPPEPTARRDSAGIRAAAKARTALEAADRSLEAAELAEQSEAARIPTLTAGIAELQAELDDAKKGLERARRELRSARTRRREARTALDRAERRLDGEV